MAGEIDGDEKEKDLNIPFERTINGIKAWKRAIVTVAGVTFNFIFAIILIGIYIFGNGINSNDNSSSIIISSFIGFSSVYSNIKLTSSKLYSG